MKILFLLLFASVTFGQSIQEKVAKFENAKEISVSFDKFKKTTEVDTDVQIKGKNGTRSMNVFLSFAGDPMDVSLYLFAFTAERHSYFNQPTLRLLIDDVPYKLENDRIGEIASFVVKKDLWKALSTAKVVEFQLERFEGALDAKNLTKLRNLASLIP